jgi:diacylglycerol kinase family enzyme
LKKFLFLIETQNKTTDAMTIWQTVKPFFEQENISYQIKNVIRLDQINQLLENNSKDKIIVTIGSLNLLLQSILILDTLKVKHSAQPISFIPTKETKSLAKSIGLAEDPSLAVKQIIAAFQPVFVNLGQIEEMNHRGRWIFSHDFSLGLGAYAANVVKDTSLAGHLKPVPLKKSLNLYGRLTAIIDQEPFNVTLRLNRKYFFFKHVFAVKLSNQPSSADNPMDAADIPLQLEIITSLNFFTFILYEISRRLKLTPYLPFSHYFTDSQIQLTTNSLEFGEFDGQQLRNQFYDLMIKSFQYPFWFDPDNLSLAEKNS